MSHPKKRLALAKMDKLSKPEKLTLFINGGLLISSFKLETVKRRLTYKFL